MSSEDRDLVDEESEELLEDSELGESEDVSDEDSEEDSEEGESDELLDSLLLELFESELVDSELEDGWTVTVLVLSPVRPLQALSDIPRAIAAIGMENRTLRRYWLMVFSSLLFELRHYDVTLSRGVPRFAGVLVNIQ